MQRKRNEGGGWQAAGRRFCSKNRTVHSENRLARNENRAARNESRPAHNENHHNIRRLSSKSRFSSNVVMV